MEDLLRWDGNHIIPDFAPNGKSCAARTFGTASTAAAFFRFYRRVVRAGCDFWDLCRIKYNSLEVRG